MAASRGLIGDPATMRHGNESPQLAPIRLSDGRTLAQPTPTPPDLLTIGAWIHLDNHAWRIEDLRQRKMNTPFMGGARRSIAGRLGQG